MVLLRRTPSRLKVCLVTFFKFFPYALSDSVVVARNPCYKVIPHVVVNKKKHTKFYFFPPVTFPGALVRNRYRLDSYFF